MKSLDLIIIGSGNSTLEIIDLIYELNKKRDEQINIVGILDDNRKLKNKKYI